MIAKIAPGASIVYQFLVFFYLEPHPTGGDIAFQKGMIKGGSNESRDFIGIKGEREIRRNQ